MDREFYEVSLASIAVANLVGNHVYFERPAAPYDMTGRDVNDPTTIENRVNLFRGYNYHKRE